MTPEQITRREELLDDMRKRAVRERMAAQEAAKNTIDERETRLLEYFWNRETQKERHALPLDAFLFFERDREPPGGEEITDKQTTKALGMLMAKDYLKLVGDNGEIVLDTRGVRWIDRRHPSALRWWQKMLERVPPIWQIAFSAITVIVTIKELIDIVRQLFQTP